MEFRTPNAPGFGQADLSNCENEQIHLAGSIQPHGALLVLRESDWSVVQASVNASEFLDLPDSVIGQSLGSLGGDVLARVRPHLGEALNPIPEAIRCRAGRAATEFDGLLHRTSRGEMVLELERTGSTLDPHLRLERAIPPILGVSSLKNLCDETARVFKQLTGYDRVMVYRFDDHGHGEVFSEEREPDLEPFLGNWYPASDIPQIARQLYRKNRVRVLVDVEYRPQPLMPALSPISGEPLDMSLCFLRSMSPIHIQYLKNMGVAATLVVSLVVDGELWGLIACHHYKPRMLHYEERTMCELLAETISTRIAALQSFERAEMLLTVRRLEQRMIETVARDGDWRRALFDNPQALLHPIDATGAALLFEDEVRTVGEVPSTPDLRQIGKWLDRRPQSQIVVISSLESEMPEFARLTPIASGLIAIPVSTTPGEYLMWFRPERIRTVTWGGNPFKPVEVGDDPRDLSPRRSFSKWHQLVEGTAESWSHSDIAAARMIGDSVADVLLQFRSVRMLIARHQLEQVSGQVRSSDQPVMVTDPDGEALLTNSALHELLEIPEGGLMNIRDLADLFADPAAVREKIDDLLSTGRTWLGEVKLAGGSGSQRILMVRADPVHASPARKLGFVLFFNDLTERKAAEVARREFQDEVIAKRRLVDMPLNSKTDLVYRSLLSSLVGNTQLAALEITDDVDVGRIPEMLQAIRISAERTERLLGQLIWHASRSSRPKPDDESH